MLRIFECLIRVFEVGTAILAARIEEDRVELSIQIVMMRNIPAFILFDAYQAVAGLYVAYFWLGEL